MAVDISGQIKARAQRNAGATGTAGMGGATMGMTGPVPTGPDRPKAPTDPVPPPPTPPDDDPFNHPLPGDPRFPPGTEKNPPGEFDWAKWFEENFKDDGGGGGGGFTPFKWEGGDPEAFSFHNLTLPTWVTPGEFVAPTVADLESDAGYQSRIRAGERAIERSAAAKGTLLTGGTLQDLETFAQDYASSELDKVYARKFQEHESLWNHSLQKYQADVDAAYKTWSSNFEKERFNWSANRENFMFAFENARQAWADQQNASAQAAAAAERRRQEKMQFFRDFAGF